MAAATHTLFFREGDHICLFYRTVEEQLETLATFIKIGLDRDECCFCVLPDDRGQQLLSRLQTMGIDTRNQVSRGALVLAAAGDTYLSDGSFDQNRMAKMLESSLRESLSAGFRAFRAAGDLGWAACDPGYCSQLPEYETLMGQFYPGRPALGLCMYDTNLFSKDLLRTIMDQHQIALSSADNARRTMRVRNGSAFADIIFDSEAPSLFHYTVQKDGSSEFITVGQERSLASALATVRSTLRSHWSA